MEFKNLLLEHDGDVAILTINRPKALNALNSETLSELATALDELGKDSNVKAVVITGSGEKAFVAGADISQMKDFNTLEGRRFGQLGQTVFRKLELLPQPVIAAINGFALGGGLELAMACHIRVAAENAKLGLPEVTLGLIPGYGGTQRLTQLVGRGKALEMILTADMIEASEAHKLGLVNHVVGFEELLPTSEKLIRRILGRSPNAVSAAIKAVNASLDSSKNGFEVEIEEFGKCFGTDDFKEGVAAFLEKRKVNFKRI